MGITNFVIKEKAVWKEICGVGNPSLVI